MKKYLLPIIFLSSILQSKAQTITDVDGNTYNTVTIGTQIWMKENLKTTKYNDGTAILQIKNQTEWVETKTAAYCWNSFDVYTYKATYGALYNWYVVNTGKLCPVGWHVPAYTDWDSLITRFGGLSVAGGKLKEAGTAHWWSPNQGADNSSGFTGLPGGLSDPINVPPNFHTFGGDGNWWSSSEIDSIKASYLCLMAGYEKAGLWKYHKRFGFSVRCLKDNNSVDQVTVTFNVDSASAVQILTVTKNATIIKPTDPTKSGYTFAGWYKEAACVYAWDFTTDVVTSDITLYAKWTEINTSISRQTVSNFKMYPNPAKEKLYFEYAKISNACIMILDLQGKQVVNRLTSSDYIDISILSKGIYIVKIIDSESTVMIKLIKE